MSTENSEATLRKMYGAGITQTQLAREIGVSRAYLSEYFGGRRIGYQSKNGKPSLHARVTRALEAHGIEPSEEESA